MKSCWSLSSFVLLTDALKQWMFPLKGKRVLYDPEWWGGVGEVWVDLQC